MHSGKSLNLSLRRRPRRRIRRLLGLAIFCAALPFWRAAAAAAPAWLAARLTPVWAAERQELEADNAALHTELAAAADLQAENTALRALLHSPAPRPAALAPARALAQSGTGMLLWCSGGCPAPGAAVLDCRGRLAGRVGWVRGALVWVPAPDGEACFVGEDPALLCCEGENWRVAGLPVPASAPAGALVTTPEGLWLGRLTAAPVPEAASGGLTAAAPLCDTAQTGGSRYFVAVEEETGYNREA